MVDISTRAHVGADGTLRVEVSTELHDIDVSVRLLVEAISPPLTASRQAWPTGFFERTYGSLSNDPLQRLPQGEYQVREAI